MKRALAWIIALSTALAPAASRAAAPADVASARAHYERGMALVSKRDYAAAVVELERAYAVAPSYKILYNLGLAYEELPDAPAALKAFERYLREAEPSAPAAQRAEAERRVAVLRAQVGLVTIHASASGAAIAVDGAAVGETPLAEPLVLVAGHHRIVATAPGQAPVSRSFDVAPGERLTVDLDPALTTAPAPAPILTLAEAAEAFGNGDLDAARLAAERFVERGHLDRAEVVRAYALLARASALTSREPAARDAFVQVLLSEPDYALPPGDPPRVREALAQAQSYWRGTPSAPGLEASAAFAKGGVTLRITVRDPSGTVRRVRVGYRFAPGDPFVAGEVLPPSGLVSIVGVPATAAAIEYYAVALDAHESERLQAGAADAPRRDPRPREEPAPRSFFARPVVWIGAAVIVAGAIAAVYAATQGTSDGTPARAAFNPSLRCGESPCE
jgi:tetratricopeptide (TPR) repeat protein